jgi:hypothetical protein
MSLFYDGRFRELSLKEIACSCGCGFNEIPLELAEIFMIIRRSFGEGIRINSGCRCDRNNKRVGSTSTNHTRGLALDISQWQQGTAKQRKFGFARLCNAVGVAKAHYSSLNIGYNSEQHFIHIDINYDGTRRVGLEFDY